MNDVAGTVIKQHLIDPEICIRCNTCEETCPIDAVTHNEDNYVVDAAKCNYCMDCISPCPTGAIDNWRVVLEPYPIEDQFSWDELPEQEEIASEDAAPSGGTVESLEDEIDRLLAEAHRGVGGRSIAPASASKPSVNLFNRARPATAIVQGNFRLTGDDTDSDVRHIILDLGDQVFPVLEGQSVGIIPPGTMDTGKPHNVRLYSVASPRDGERANTNNLALTVKREEHGLCSNYVCDLKRGDEVQLTGPFGATFLMPDDPSAEHPYDLYRDRVGAVSRLHHAAAALVAQRGRASVPVLRGAYSRNPAVFRSVEAGPGGSHDAASRLLARARPTENIRAGSTQEGCRTARALPHR